MHCFRVIHQWVPSSVRASARVRACAMLVRYLTNQRTKFHQTLVDDACSWGDRWTDGSRSRSQQGQTFEWAIAVGRGIHIDASASKYRLVMYKEYRSDYQDSVLQVVWLERQQWSSAQNVFLWPAQKLGAVFSAFVGDVDGKQPCKLWRICRRDFEGKGEERILTSYLPVRGVGALIFPW